MENRREILPAVYNPKQSEGRTARETELLSSNEYNRALGSGFAALNNRFVIKTEKFCDEISELRQRIVKYNLNGDDGLDLDDSDIEHLCDEVDNSDSDSDIEFQALVPKPAQVIVKTENDISPNTSNANNNSQSNEQMVDDVSSTNENEVTNDENGSEAENNVFSGSIAFEKNDVDDYYFREYNVSIRAGIAKILTAWNTTYPFDTAIYDKRFVGVLLKEIYNNQYADDKLDERSLSLIKQLFDVRVKNDENRFEQFDAIVTEKREKAKKKIRTNVSM